MRRRAAWRTLLAATALVGLGPAAALATDYHYAVPVAQSSPWPTMRRDLRNTAYSPVVGRYQGDLP